MRNWELNIFEEMFADTSRNKYRLTKRGGMYPGTVIFRTVSQTTGISEDHHDIARELERYKRQILSFGEDGQEKLRKVHSFIAVARVGTITLKAENLAMKCIYI